MKYVTLASLILLGFVAGRYSAPSYTPRPASSADTPAMETPVAEKKASSQPQKLSSCMQAVTKADKAEVIEFCRELVKRIQPEMENGSGSDEAKRKEDAEYQIVFQRVEEGDPEPALKNKLSDPAAAVFRSRAVDQDHGKLKNLLGSYRGWVSLNTGRKWWVELSMTQETKQDHSIVGKYDLKIFRDGEEEPFSHTGGNGNFRHLRVADKGEGLFLKVHEDQFFHVFLNQRSSAFIGNLYTRKEEFEHEGTVFLQR